MNPYSRFALVSNSVTAAVVMTVLILNGGHLATLMAGLSSSPLNAGLTLAGGVAVLVVFWMASTEVIFPSLFRVNLVRQMILGRYYVEGTWLQAEKAADASRIAVIDIQPNGKTFTFSGYALDENLDVDSNILIELANFEWPFLSFTYRNSLSDGADGQRNGIGEVQFEMNQSASRRYNGFSQYIKSATRTRLEGAKIVKSKDVRELRTLEGREEIFDEYWSLFFDRKERAVRARTQTVAQRQAAREAGFDPRFQAGEVRASADRRTTEKARPENLDEAIIPRRRMSDWSAEDDDALDLGKDMEAPLELTDRQDAVDVAVAMTVPAGPSLKKPLPPKNRPVKRS